MTLRLRPLAALLVLAGAALLPSSDASACGGCFHEPSEQQTTMVTGHRMAFAISTTRTVLWDQIQYAGSPSSFAWVLPIKAGGYVEVSHDAWFETLDAATSAQIISPPLDCFSSTPPSGGSGCGIGCGASAEEGASFSGGVGGSASAPPPVTITHQGTVGPYETVTLHANVPNALPNWLTSNGYAIDPSVAPIVDAYTQEGFDFIALKLVPGQGVQAMKPVRVISPGMTPTLPLRMVAAGTGAQVPITLFVIGEGRWQTQNFPSASVTNSSLVWDFNSSSSNYSEARAKLLASNGGRTWNNAYARQGSLLSPVQIEGGFGFVQYQVNDAAFATIGEAYVNQGVSDGDGSTTSCTTAITTLASSTDEVVDLCNSGAGGGGTGGGGTGGTGGAGGGGTGGMGTGGMGTGGMGGASCGMLPPDKLDSRAFACGTLDDLATALVGMHPADVWLTRLESNLPHAALADDLTLEASPEQGELTNVFNVTNIKNSPCASGMAAVVRPGKPGGTAAANRLALLGAVVAAVGATVARRRRRLLPVRIR